MLSRWHKVFFGLLVLLSGAVAVAEEVLILESHSKAAQARVDTVMQARKTIDAAYFIYNDDPTGLAGLYLLREAARRGVQVRLIVDSQWNKISGAIIAHLIEEGVQIRLYHRFSLCKPFWWTRRMHDKLLIVDDLHLIAGGRNIENPYFGLGAKLNYIDRDIYLRGKIAQDASRYFEELWLSRHVSNPPVSRVSRGRVEAAARRVQGGVDFLQSSPILEIDGDSKLLTATTTVDAAKFLHDKVAPIRKKPGIRQDLVEILETAEHSVLIESPYLVVTKGMIELFQELLDRKVRIRLLTNSLLTTDNVWPQAGYVGKKKKLVQMGIELWEYTGPESLHSKSAVIDGRLVLIGSYNLDPRSERLNTEIAVVVEHHGLAADLEASMETNLARSWKIGANGKPEGHQRRHPGVGFCKRLKVFFARLILPCIRGQL